MAHKRQKRQNKQGRPLPRLAQQLGGDEIVEAFAPAGFLNYEQSATPLDNVADGFFLTFAETGIGLAGAEAEKFDHSLGVVGHSRPSPADRWAMSSPPDSVNLLIRPARRPG